MPEGNNISKYGETIVNPVLRDGEDVAIWYRRLEFSGLLRHPDDSFLHETRYGYMDLDEDTARALDASRERVFEIVRDPYTLAMAVIPTTEPVCLGLDADRN